MTNHKHKTKTQGQPADLTFTDEPPALSPFVDDWPTPYRFLTIPGYHLGNLGAIRGPAYFPSLRDGQANDQLLTVVSEAYDTTTHTTRVGLVYGIVRKRATA